MAVIQDKKFGIRPRLYDDPAAFFFLLSNIDIALITRNNTSTIYFLRFINGN